MFMFKTIFVCKKFTKNGLAIKDANCFWGLQIQSIKIVLWIVPLFVSHEAIVFDA